VEIIANLGGQGKRILLLTRRKGKGFENKSMKISYPTR
jgi:hypothetical protein